MQNYLQGLGGLQGYGDKAYETNQLAPYLQQQEKITQLQGAGNENIGGGIASGFETIGSSIAANSVGNLTAQGMSLKSLNLNETQVKEAIKDLSPNDTLYKLYKQYYPQYFLTDPSNSGDKSMNTANPDNQINIAVRPGESRETLADNSKIFNTFGWTPKVSIKDWINIQVCKLLT
jgi:hypothetical protein